MADCKKKSKVPGYVPFLLDILNSIAYISMTHSARGLLPYLMAKVKVPVTHPERYEIEFSFSYTEGRRFKFSNDSTEKALRQFINHGFVDPVSLGGLRGLGKSSSTFKLSERWRLYGTPHHEPIDWDKWKVNYELR